MGGEFGGGVGVCTLSVPSRLGDGVDGSILSGRSHPIGVAAKHEGSQAHSSWSTGEAAHGRARKRRDIERNQKGEISRQNAQKIRT